MKLLLCRKCNDVFSLALEKRKACECGATAGTYVDNLYAVYTGQWAMPLGFANWSIAAAVANQPEKAPGRRFEAFVIEKDCLTFKKVPSL